MPKDLILDKRFTLEEKLDLIRAWAADLKPRAFDYNFKSTFRTLNHSSRWKYIWQEDTVTHNKFLMFLILFKMKMKKEDRDSDNLIDVIDCVKNVYKPKYNDISFYLTLYLIIKVFKIKKNELHSTKLKLDSLKPKMLLSETEFISDSLYQKHLDEIDLVKFVVNMVKDPSRYKSERVYVKKW